MKATAHPKFSDFKIAKQEFTQKVAAGLRAMKVWKGNGQPDFFLLLSGPIRDEFTFEEILGIPVIEAPFQLNTMVPDRPRPDTSGKIHCPVIPLWKGENDSWHDLKAMAFQKGYMNA